MRRRHVVYVLTYPQGSLLYKLTDWRAAPVNLCSDAKGDVFVSASTSTESGVIYEFAHGGKQPIATMNNPGSTDGCSVDPTTGSVAVANYFSPLHQHHSNIAVFGPGQSSPKIYHQWDLRGFKYCTYDSAGNLFAEAGDRHGLVLVELPHGSDRFVRVTLNKPIEIPGPIQWDGTDLAIGYPKSDAVYRVAVSGSTGTVVGSVLLKSPHGKILDQFWIDGHTLMVPFAASGTHAQEIGFWKYPGGGKIVGSLHSFQGATYLFAATVSVAPQR